MYIKKVKCRCSLKYQRKLRMEKVYVGITVLRGGEIWWYITGLGIQGSSYVTSGMNHLASGKLQFFISEMNIRPVFPNSQEVL